MSTSDSSLVSLPVTGARDLSALSPQPTDNSATNTQPGQKKGTGMSRLRIAMQALQGLGATTAAAAGNMGPYEEMQREQQQSFENKRQTVQDQRAQAAQDLQTREAEQRIADEKATTAKTNLEVQNYRTPDQIAAANLANTLKEKEGEEEITKKFARPDLVSDESGAQFSVNPYTGAAVPVEIQQALTSKNPPNLSALAPPNPLAAAAGIQPNAPRGSLTTSVPTGQQLTTGPKTQDDFTKWYLGTYLKSPDPKTRKLPDPNDPNTELNARALYNAKTQTPERPPHALGITPGGQAIDIVPGMQVPTGTTSATATPDVEFQKANVTNASKDIATARGADFRYRSMEASYPKALAGSQQDMVNILMNHIGMTMGLQRGARMNQATIQEAEQSSPLLASIVARYGPDAIGPDSTGLGVTIRRGVVLTPDQMKQMVDLGASQRVNAWQQAYDSADQAGLSSKVQIPGDVKIQRSPTGGGGGNNPPPTIQVDTSKMSPGAAAFFAKKGMAKQTQNQPTQ